MMVVGLLFLFGGVGVLLTMNRLLWPLTEGGRATGGAPAAPQAPPIAHRPPAAPSVRQPPPVAARAGRHARPDQPAAGSARARLRVVTVPDRQPPRRTAPPAGRVYGGARRAR
ncbi:hypothetical protein [Asanoa iriomotensis]|uniref:Uncharacterized protein n=1 Tax=Asanoa iriomotensis TaxID=234613 RepID=A0ABQ4CD11_9ACTN|nr:hypothetical protein [Asanoa iriomotensis]GIF60356.1 hypothetical protein Air01nite_64510 [Asanoa iriomotensis]